jgi:hypothetical protein
VDLGAAATRVFGDFREASTECYPMGIVIPTENRDRSVIS